MAINDPKTVAHKVEMRAMRRLTHSALVNSSCANGFAQLSSVKPCHLMLNLPFGALNENATMTKIGRKMYAKPRPANVLITRWPMRCRRENAVMPGRLH